MDVFRNLQCLGLTPATPRVSVWAGDSTQNHSTETSYFVRASVGLAEAMGEGRSCLFWPVCHSAGMPWAPLGLDTPFLCCNMLCPPFLWGNSLGVFVICLMLKWSWFFSPVIRSSLLGIEPVFLHPNDIFLISLGKKTNAYQMQESTTKALFVSSSQAQSSPWVLSSRMPVGRERPETWKSIFLVFGPYFC